MNLKNNKIIKVLGLTGILSIGIFSGYKVLNKDVTLIVNGEERTVSTFKPNVKELLKEQNIKYDGNDIVSVDLEKELANGDKIEVTDVKEEIVRESKNVPYEINIVEEVVSIEPVNKVVKKGTKVETQIASSRGISSRGQMNQSSSNRKHMSVVATAYTGHSITSTGTTPKWGTIAVDPSVIPYGTKVYIPQFDMTFIAEDTGSAINGNKIDIYMQDEAKVKKWGRNTIEIYVIG